MKVLKFIAKSLAQVGLGAVLYAAVLGLGTFVMLLGSATIGYPPSDRAGPAWHEAGIPPWGETLFYWRFAMMSVPAGLRGGATLTFFAQVLSAFGARRWFIGMLGGPLAGLLGWLAVWIYGSYFGTPDLFFKLGGLSGFLFGAVILPLLVPKPAPPKQLRDWRHVVLASGVMLLAGRVICTLCNQYGVAGPR